MNKTLASKLLTFIIVSVLVVTLFFSGLTYLVIRSGMETQMKNDGHVLITSLIREIENYEDLALGDIQTVFSTVKENSQGGIVYLSISDSDGNLLVTDEEVLGVDAVSSASMEETEGATQASDTNVKVDVAGYEGVYNITEKMRENAWSLNLGLSLNSMYDEIADAMVTIALISLAFLVVIIGIGIIFSKVIVRGLKGTIHGLQELAKGDLTVQMNTNGKDEFGHLNRALEHFTSDLRRTLTDTVTAIQEFEKIANTLGETNKNINGSSKMLSDSTEQIMDILENQRQTTQNLEVTFRSFESMLDDMSRKTATVQDGNENIMKVSQTGNNHLSQLVDAMRDVTDSFDVGTKHIEQLNTNVSVITEITEVINSVAQQTNLLALNAAIEAARAGESGRGFAIVAEEIKKLAEQVIQSSEDINQSTEQMKFVVYEVTESNKGIAERIDHQKAFVDNTVESFTHIRDEVKHTTNQLTELMQHIRHIETSKNQIVQDLQDVHSISEQAESHGQQMNTIVITEVEEVETLSKISSSIFKLGKQLKENVRKFKI